MLDSIFHSCFSALAFAAGLLFIAIVAIALDRAISYGETRAEAHDKRLFSILRATALGFFLIDCGVLSWFAATSALHIVGLI